MGSETLPSTFYILTDEFNMPFYLMSNWHKIIYSVRAIHLGFSVVLLFQKFYSSIDRIVRGWKV